MTMGVVHGAPKVGVSYRGFAVLMFFIVFLDLSVACVSFLLLAGLFRLFSRFRDEPAFGVPLSREQHPHFFELLDRVCKKLKVRPPTQCYLSPFSEMSISDRTIEEDGRLRRGVRTLVVGAGLLVHLRIDELTTILCHEMAHARAGDTRLGRLATRFNYAMIAAIYEQYEEEAQSAQNTWLNTLVRRGRSLHRAYMAQLLGGR